MSATTPKGARRLALSITAVPVLLSGLHCSPESSQGEETHVERPSVPDEPPDEVWETTHEVRPRPSARASDASSLEVNVELPVSAISTVSDAEYGFAGNPNAHVTSSVSASDGSRFIAGLFSGTMTVGDVVLHSRGGDDVFFARLLSDGTIDWIKSVGSRKSERGAHIKFDDDRVTLIAMMEAAVDCGSGPLYPWSSESFFVCVFDVTGEPLIGSAFPTGRP